MACPELLGPLAQELLDCWSVALFECGRPACRYFLAAQASVAWDECCDCADANGMAWVSLNSITPLNTNGVTPCGWEYEATFSLSVLRCDATVIQGDGTVPGPDVFTAQAREQMLDAEIARKAIVCCFGEGKDPGDYILGGWTPLGPDGGCVGGSTVVTVRFSGCACDEA